MAAIIKIAIIAFVDFFIILLSPFYKDFTTLHFFLQ